MLTRRALAGIVLRLAGGTLLSVWLAWTWGAPAAQLYRPLLAWIYGQLDSDSTVQELRIADHGANGNRDTVYALTVRPRTAIFVGRRMLVSNPAARGTISVLTAYLWLPCATALPLLLAWPARRAREWPLRLLGLLGLGSLVALVDLPTVLWSEVWADYVGSAAPGSFSVLLLWGHLLENGGQSLLGIVMAGCCVALAQRPARA